MTEMQQCNATLAEPVRIEGGSCALWFLLRCPWWRSFLPLRLLPRSSLSEYAPHRGFGPGLLLSDGLCRGSTVLVMSSFASGLAAAYFVYPPHDSILIYDPRHAAELGFS